MQSFKSSDDVILKYLDTALLPDSTPEDLSKPWLILIHGFTGTHKVWQRNIPAFQKHYRVIAPDLRGHGDSDAGARYLEDPRFASVEQLALDLKELIEKLARVEGNEFAEWRGRLVGGSLGCAVIWYFARIYTTTPFTHTLFIDQSPLQNTSPTWLPPYCHKGLNDHVSLRNFTNQMLTSPRDAHIGTITSCLGYLSHPSSVQSPSQKSQQVTQYAIDEPFFLGEALKGTPEFYVALMTDHTALDHRENIRESFGPGSGSVTRVLVVASKKSGCFEPKGVLSVVGFVNGDDDTARGRGGLARGEVVEWGGHWCYWEDCEKFNELALEFLGE